MVPSRSITKAVATRFRPPPGVWSRSQRAKVVRARSQTVWWIAIPDFAWGSGKYSASGSRKVRSTFTAITHLLQWQRRGAAWAGRVRRGVASGAAAEPDSPHFLYRPNEEEISRGWSGGLRRAGLVALHNHREYGRRAGSLEVVRLLDPGGAVMPEARAGCVISLYHCDRE